MFWVAKQYIIKQMKATCEICKTVFNRSPQHIKRVKHVFCSRACRGISHRGVGNPMWKDEFKTCLFCEGKYKGKGEFYCSQKCMGLHKRNRLETNCAICGKDIARPHIYLGTDRFCSKTCADIAHAKRIKGKGNPNWKGGIANLPWGVEFNQELKKDIRKRDKNKCRLCDKKEVDLIKIKGCGLNVHHIDYNKNNNKPENLISLCNSCHGMTHYKRTEWKKKLSSLLGG